MSQKYGFVHPTKTAGSEIRAQLEKDLPMVPGLGHTSLSEQYDEDVVWIGSVRNPYTRVYSIYNYFNEQWKDLDFISFCCNIETIMGAKVAAKEADKNIGLTCFEMLSMDGKLGVNHIIRFENLHEDMAKLSNALGLETPIVLPPPSHSHVWLQNKFSPRVNVKGDCQLSVAAVKEAFPNWEFPEWFREGIDEIWGRATYRQQNRNWLKNSEYPTFTRETLDTINKVFDKDFETFGYNKI
jgi:hypothetical protein